MFSTESLSIWIVTYNRPKAINRAVRDWLASTPDHVPVNIISNHSSLKLDQDYGPRVKVFMNELRPDESWGYLPRNWNQCFYLGFKEHDWVLCSQDDVQVRPGWVERLQESKAYDFYAAPFFDVMFMMNRKAFLKVGWFDERFVVMDYHDNDYLRRAYQRLGWERISVHDRHGWRRRGKKVGVINDIGLGDFWIHGPDEGYIRPDDHPRDLGPMAVHSHMNAEWLFKKWGAIVKVNHTELELRQRLPDIDWYPWFTQWLRDEVRIGAKPWKKKRSWRWWVAYVLARVRNL